MQGEREAGVVSRLSWYNRKMSRGCPGIGWATYGALNSNEDTFDDLE